MPCSSFTAQPYPLLSEEQLKEQKVYRDLDEALREPEKVFILDLTGQHLTFLPNSIGRLKNLQVLKLGWKIKDSTPRRVVRHSKHVGGGIIHLDRLQGKYIDYNALTSLPDSISQLQNLQKVYLGYNQLASVPFILAQLKNLQFIDLIGNYDLLTNEEGMRTFKKQLPERCLLYSDLRL
jgi:leucine-rich repeat protein SHOC2